MRRLFLVLAVLAFCSSATAEVIVQVPDKIVQTPTSQYDFPLDLSFLLTAPTVSQTLVGYDLAIKVTTSDGSGLSIIGVGTGADRPVNSVLGSDPAFTVQDDPIAGTLYTFNDFMISGSGTISEGSSLLRIKARLQPGAVGTYHINVFSDPSSALDSRFYSGLDGDGNPIAIAGMTFQGATVNIVPEPCSIALLGTGLLAIGLVVIRRFGRQKRVSALAAAMQ